MRLFSLLLLLFIPILSFCSPPLDQDPHPKAAEERGFFEKPDAEKESEPPIDLFQYPQSASEWGEEIDGVKTRLDTSKKVLALTFDACGGAFGSGYDEELISFLQAEEIPATLFISGQWVTDNEENKALMQELADDPLFQIENHGRDHLPLSVDGRTAWGIEGTSSPEEIKNEVVENQEILNKYTTNEPSYFRAGTAHVDDVAVQIVNDLHLEIVNYSIAGDGGGTFTKTEVEDALVNAHPGDIALLHMNQPESETFEGVKAAVSNLQQEGFEFATLDEYELK
ncbi:polysaccharide deacetylase family protein [Salsuginibacillus kocurii]|uniref:polysaccharide deacetylase family protein n=1 Tax=Salsuginibacillus kocurii TaxID=427078 RepID=UPI00036FCDC0|nr:polysaccharide deacetylase family protein [Salsuginibacillus kocurii]